MKKIIHPNINDIDFADENLSAFFDDGKAYRAVTKEMIDKIISGELIVTEYHEEPLGNVIYISAHSLSN